MVNCTFFCSFPLVHGLVVARLRRRKRTRPFAGRLGRQPVIDRSGRLVIQRLMASPVVVKVQILGQRPARLFRAGVLFQVDLLVLDGAPEPFGKDIVGGPAFAVHADLDTGRQQQLRVLWAGEMTALVAVPDQRRRLGQGSLGGRQDEGHLQRLAEFPSDDVAREPVNDRYQV